MNAVYEIILRIRFSLVIRNISVYMSSFLLQHHIHTLRKRCHSFVLPQCGSNLFRFSFVIRCLFRFV